MSKNREKVIVGDNGEYKYVPVMDFVVEDTGGVFYTKHPYSIPKGRELATIGRVSRARNFLEVNDITRNLKTKESKFKMFDSMGTRLERELIAYRNRCKNDSGLVEMSVHFRNFQVKIGDDKTLLEFYSGGRELIKLTNYNGRVCWGSHRISQKVPKELAYDQYLNMEFNHDLSGSIFQGNTEPHMRKLVNVIKFHGYDNDSVEWLSSKVLRENVRGFNGEFAIFDLYLVLSYFGICADDYLVSW